MSHPEDRSMTTLMLEQQESIMREAFRMAERVVGSFAKKHTWASEEARERYLSSVPMVALEFKGMYGQLMGMHDQHSQKQMDRIYESCQEVLQALRHVNDESEKKGDA